MNAWEVGQKVMWRTGRMGSYKITHVTKVTKTSFTTEDGRRWKLSGVSWGTTGMIYGSYCWKYSQATIDRYNAEALHGDLLREAAGSIRSGLSVDQLNRIIAITQEEHGK